MKYIGIDGGGTKTKFSLFNEEGKKEKDVLKPEPPLSSRQVK